MRGRAARFALTSIFSAIALSFGCGGDDTIEPTDVPDASVEDVTSDSPVIGNDAGADAPTDTPKITCNPQAAFVTANEVPGLHLQGASEISARFTPDGLTAIVTRKTENEPFEKLHLATRASITAAFTPGSPLGGPVNEMPGGISSRGFLADNGLTLFFESPKEAGSADYDLFFATRDSTAASFGPAATVGVGTNVATTEFEGQPYFVAEQLFFGRKVNGAFAIHRAPRTSGAFTTPVNVVPNLGVSGAPVVSADQLTIFLAREDDIWFATRTSPTGDFGEVKKLDAPVNTGEYEEPTDVSPDGCLLYFTRGPVAGLGERRAYVATRGQ